MSHFTIPVSYPYIYANGIIHFKVLTPNAYNSKYSIVVIYINITIGETQGGGERFINFWFFAIFVFQYINVIQVMKLSKVIIKQ